MQIEVINSEVWEQLNDEIKIYLSLKDESKIRVFTNLYQAVYEICQGTSQFMSHKKSIATVMGLSSFSNGILPAYYRDLYEVQNKDFRALNSVDSLDEWISSLKKETCFTLFFAEHSITGESFSQALSLEKKMSEKRIFSILVSQDISWLSSEMSPYAVRVVGLPSGRAVVRMGARYRAPSILSTNIQWQISDSAKYIKDIEWAQKIVTEISKVEEFERKFSKDQGLYPLIPFGTPRTSDRCILISEEVHAEALAKRFKEKFVVQGDQDLVYSLSGCQWGYDDIFADWWTDLEKLKVTPSQVLIIDASLLAQSNCAEVLKSTYMELIEQQSWKL